MTQQPTTPVLFQDITLACVDPWGRNVDVPTTLGFCPHDPYAVTMTPVRQSDSGRGSGHPEDRLHRYQRA